MRRGGLLTIACALLCAFGAWACGPGSVRDRGTGGSFEAQERDSAGVHIVELPAFDPEALPEWTIGPEPLITIGQADGDPAYLFEFVAAARLMEGGQILVADGDRTNTLRVFDSSGVLVSTFGGTGEGPEEFAGINAVSQVVDGQVAVLDERLARVSIVDLRTGEFSTGPAAAYGCRDERNMEAAQASECGRPQVRFDGRVVTLRRERVSDPVPATWLQIPPRPSELEIHAERQRVRLATGRTGPVIMVPNAMGGLNFFPALFAPGDTLLPFGTRFILARPWDRALDFLDDDGALLRVVREAGGGPAVDAAWMEPYRVHADTASRGFPGLKVYVQDFRYEGERIPWGETRVDLVGRIWIRDYRPPRAYGVGPTPGWTVLDTLGTPIARVRSDLVAGAMDIGADHLVVRSFDEFGVQRVEVYLIRRGVR